MAPAERFRGLEDLHDYQVETVKAIMARPRLVAILDMGAGKTISTLTAFAMLQAAGKVDHLFVWAPKAVAKTVWAQEAAAWSHTAHLEVNVALGTAKQRARALDDHADVYVMSYDNAQEDMHQRVPGPRDMVVYDELTRLKGVKSVRGKALRKHTARARRFLGLTGTPKPKDRQDLFMQAASIDSRLWGPSFYKWRAARFRTTDFQGYQWTELQGEAERIDEEYKSISFRIRPHRQPDPVFIRHELELPEALRRASNLALQELVLSLPSGLDEEARIDRALASAAVGSIKARQIGSGTVIEAEPGEGASRAHVLWGGKFDAVEEIVEESGGEPVLVLYQFVEERNELMRRFPKAARLDDDRSMESVVAAWNAGDVAMLIGHPASMGHGLNLQHGGRRLIWLSLPWSLEQYLQAIARLNRQGQREQVYVHLLMAQGSLDELVLARLQGRDEEQRRFMAAVLAAS
jgi:SNF2 family DNA or RNA helicase